ncbi:hypothetical protein KIW84_043807 [Lathyrus oleraceus]|uniref:ABC1 atypical kinase-like domain-containing protein n=1 Tax=Pisum sativum TaxID=3888 RepID=A0A9D5AS86_PEA|nr:hypothetical protein KIW84_043807 [Pisum sativum]
MDAKTLNRPFLFRLYSTQPPHRRQHPNPLHRHTETAVCHESHKPLTVPFLIPTTNHSNSSLQFQPHNSSNQLSSRRCSVTCTAVSIGSDCDDSFTAKSEILPEPVAAASLWKVYQARLCRTGQVVAVKVQRRGVQASV